MAKPSWLTTEPNSGSGNGNINNSATAHTGREVRTGTVTVTGVGDGHEAEIPAQYKANGLATNNGEAIAGDPGASAEYASLLELTLPANETVDEVNRVLKVTTAGGQSAQITIKQAAGDAFLTIDPKEITLEADGSAVSVTVKSNTTWSVS